MEASEEREQTVLSLEFSMGIIKIYNSAIGIIRLYKVPQNWLDEFYDLDDAAKAYKMFEKYLQTYKYHGAHSNSWVQNDIRILKSILFDLHHGKF